MRDDNSITNPLNLSSFNGRSRSQLRLETPPSFNNSRSDYRSCPIIPAIKARAKRLAKKSAIQLLKIKSRNLKLPIEDQGKEWPNINGTSFKSLMGSSGKCYC
ncbi:hypothetical protein BPAE_0060g00290 [Botrytis paeoniae]|uniref:Uncharacterized protein n=1 Tax=Botrytis paeoniae TaxID=278948 RepID=A0A4Z1FW93_9HELO|nr:hypothetical protein BPAE_0060g00290 [Botrytis paeoniae]